MTNVTLGGKRRKQRRQLSVLVRYCTSPHTLQRTTSRSISEAVSPAFFSPTGHPHRLFRRCGGEERFNEGKAETGASGILSIALAQVKCFFRRIRIFPSGKNSSPHRREKAMVLGSKETGWH